MINLLPPNYAMQIRYGRRNANLRRWLLGMLVATTGLVVIIAGGWLYLDSQAKSLEHDNVSGQQELKAQNLTQVQKDATEISGDVKVINQVLSREIKFSALMQDIGKAMPPGTILGSLTLNKIDGAIDLSANAKDYTSAAQIAVNLSDSKNNLFSSVDIVSVNCSGGNTTYKCSANFKALFRNTAKSRYLNATARPSGG